MPTTDAKPLILAQKMIQGIQFTFEQNDLDQLERLFPKASWQLRNQIYPAIHTRTPEGERVDVYVRRAIADLMLRERGEQVAKGFTVEVRDGDPTNLTRENLRLVFNEDREAGEIKRKNGYQAHRIVGIRLAALSEGLDPDVAITGGVKPKRHKKKRRSKSDVSASELAEMQRLKAVEGLSHMEIGERHNLSPASVKGLLKGTHSTAEEKRRAQPRWWENMDIRNESGLSFEPDDFSAFVIVPNGQPNV